jgi:hypothetical protein
MPSGESERKPVLDFLTRGRLLPATEPVNAGAHSAGIRPALKHLVTNLPVAQAF